MSDHTPGSFSRIFVSGDVVEDHFIYEGCQRRVGSAIRLGTFAQAVGGGAAMLAKLLETVANKSAPSDGTDAVALGKFSSRVDRGLDESKLPGSLATGYCVMRPFEKQPESKDLVWRMAEALGFSEGRLDPDLTAVNKATLAADHDIVVLDDAGLGFRRWPANAAWPQFLINPGRPLPEWLVIKMSGPITAGDLWHTLVSGQTQDQIPQAIRDSSALLSRTIAVVSINDLRVEPIHVMKRLSWERTALDLLNELQNNPSLAGLRKVRFVVISLDTDGALIAEFPQDGGDPRFRLIFDPARLEGDFDAEIHGTLFGYQTCLTAAIVTHLTASKATDAAGAESLEKGVRSGLCAMRRLLIEGHGPVGKPNAITPADFPHAALAREILSEDHDWSYGAVSIPANIRESERWTVVAGSNLSGTSKPLWGLARRVAIQGVKQLTQTPYLRFGKLFTIERTEIERLRTLQRLLLSYQKDVKAEKPLSIAVFGPPGSGKSFGVKELARAIFSEKVPLLEFNLSQFQDASDLHGLFHQVRDCVLRGKLPVVFWDEFDSQNLHWLQYLLAPMQDGTFQDGQVTHPIGKCVFVFAGGTRWRLEDFGELLRQPSWANAVSQHAHEGEKSQFDEEREMIKQKQEFVALKVPDFKSRLAGYLNVLGPNPHGDDDLTFPVRRALLLRVHLGIAEKAPLTIDSGLLSAFLEIDEYRHGARSLEKIAEQIRLASRTGEFTRSDLPSRSQLNLHVDAEKFLQLAGGSL